LVDLLNLKRRVVVNPNDAEARFSLAEAFFTDQQHRAARTQLERCLGLSPGHANALRLLSQVNRAMGELSSARRALEKLVETAPTDPERHEALADSFLEGDRPDDALVSLLDAVRLSPPSPQRYVKAASLARRTLRADLARGLLEHALLDWPTEARLTEERGRLLEELGDDDVFDLVNALQPGDPLAAIRALVVREDLSGARRALVAATAHDARPEYHLLRGELSTLDGDAARAKKAFDKARNASRRPLATGRLSAAVTRGAFRRMGVLGWTPHGGAVSPLEAVAVLGRGELFFSGNVRGSGLEAGRVAYSCLKARGSALGISAEVVSQDLHLNFTDSEMGKEGLSSGLALALAGLAGFSGRKLCARLGATGVLTLSGEVQRVEGIHEKLTAAFLHGLERILVPRLNRADAEALPPGLRARLEIQYVSTLEDAWQHAVQ
jgi:ATP-dependent Lon protease